MIYTGTPVSLTSARLWMRPKMSTDPLPSRRSTRGRRAQPQRARAEHTASRSLLGMLSTLPVPAASRTYGTVHVSHRVFTPLALHTRSSTLPPIRAVSARIVCRDSEVLAPAELKNSSPARPSSSAVAAKPYPQSLSQAASRHYHSARRNHSLRAPPRAHAHPHSLGAAAAARALRALGSARDLQASVRTARGLLSC